MSISSKSMKCVKALWAGLRDPPRYEAPGDLELKM